jgi:hypothetical protein
VTRDLTPSIMRLKPWEHVTIGEKLPEGLMEVQNHGPGDIVFDGGYRKINVPPEQVRLVRTADRIAVESVDETAAIVELKFTLAPK